MTREEAKLIRPGDRLRFHTGSDWILAEIENGNPYARLEGMPWLEPIHINLYNYPKM